MKLKSLLNLLTAGLLTLSSYAAEPGEPPVPAPYPKKLDIAATNKWWEVARAARTGKIDAKNHGKGTVTVTGRHFLDLEAPRDEVVAFAIGKGVLTTDDFIQ